MTDKQSFRERLLLQRDQLSAEDVASKSQKVVSQLMTLDVWKKAKSVAVYAPIRHEVDWMNDYEELSQGRKLYWPRVCSGFVLEFYWVESVKDLRPGSFQIPEPTDLSEEKKASLQSLDCILVPGVGFDREGYRLGFGKGYYDRALKGCSKGVVVGVAYDFQIVKSLPRDSRDFHDVRCDWVVSESQVYQCV